MKRLLDDPELSSELRTDLQGSRRAGRDYDELAKLPQLKAAFAAAQSAPHLPVSGRVARVRVPLGASGWKILLLTAACGGALFIAWPRERAAPAPPAPPAPGELARPVEPPTPPPQPRAAEPEMLAPTPAPSIAPAPAPRSQPSAGSSRREIAQLLRIRTLLSDDPAAAYRLARRSEQEFPRGLLSEERQALQVIALAKSGDTSAAQRRAQEFFGRYPQSPLREQLEAALRRP